MTCVLQGDIFQYATTSKILRLDLFCEILFRSRERACFNAPHSIGIDTGPIDLGLYQLIH